MNNKCLYLHMRGDTGEVFYVGIGSLKRSHSNKDRNKYWHHIVSKIGYSVHIVRSDLTWELACKMEKYYIKTYRSIGVNLANMTDGGDGSFGRTLSEETREKISKAIKNRSPETRRKISEKISQANKNRSPEIRRKISESLRGNKNTLGYKPSLETRKKLSQAGKGRKHTEEHKKKMSELNKGKIVSEETRKKLSEINKGKSFSEETRRKIGTKHRGHKYNLGRKLSPEHILKLTQNNSKPILCHQNKTIYPSLREAALKLKLNEGHISSVCQGKRKQTGGFSFSYYAKEENEG
jgi:hypothetical protein